MRLSLFDEDARAAVDLAVEIARERGHAETTSSHLLLALASDPKARSTELLANAGVVSGTIESELERLMPTGSPLDREPPPADELKRLLDLAVRETVRLTEVRTRPEHLLLALLHELQGLARLANTNLRAAVYAARAEALNKPGLAERLMGRSARSSVYTETLSDYTFDLNDRPRHQPDPVARDAEIERAAQILARKNRRNPILVARPGVGATSVISGLALLAQDSPGRPTAAGMVRALNWDAINRSGSHGVSTVETVFTAASRLHELILCVDDTADHLDLAPGPGTDADWLWPLIARTGLRVVFAMTPDELDGLRARGSRLEQHCQAMTIAEPNAERSVAMLTAGLGRLETEHGLHITQDAAEAAVTLADRYVTDALLPLKAVHILVEACAARRERGAKTRLVDVAAVTEAVANWTGLPVGEITAPEPEPPVVHAVAAGAGSSRLPLPAQSTAVLIGTAVYDSPEIPDIRSITGNLTDLRAALAHDRSGGFAPTRTHVFADADESLRPRVAELAAEARDTLLLYFGGHGWVEADGRLYLGLRTTQPALRRYTTLPYEDLRAMVIESPARRKLVILDCCFSGHAIDMLGDTDDTAGHLDISGTYVLTATPATRMAHAPDGKRNSAFTESLLDVLRDGIEHAGELLRVADVFPQVRARLAARGLPEPQQRGTNTIGELAIARNPRHRA